ncbi:MAG: HD domain-containing protein [Thermovirgaceae bacterium]|nr:HD domain-containing protein [Thermovirgaceae bacterium]
MKDRIIKMIPEIDWIQDNGLKDKVVATIEDALRTGGWEPEDMDTIPFTLLIPDCPASLNVHNRGVIRMAKKIYEEYNPLYKNSGGFALDHDTLIAGAILHDVGKLVEYEKKDGKAVKSKMGKDLRHPFSGVGLAMRNDIPSRICHCIAVHAKEGDGAYRCPEAVVINKCDFINFETIKSFLGLL